MNMLNSYEWLAKLVAFDTTSRNSNLELIQVVSDFLSAQGFSTRLTHDETGKKANLFATLPSVAGKVSGGLVLSGHTDVVPVDGQKWATPPFVATQIDDRIYGRGACDMKGFIAVVLALVPHFKTLKLTKPLHLAFSYDEEVGCIGARSLIADFQQFGIQPDACLVGEPTLMCPVVAHKGGNRFRCRVHGRAMHSSLTPDGCNAIEYAAQLICWIRQLAEQFRREGPFDTLFNVPYTTLSTNMIQGGIAFNTIPALCEFTFEFRNLPTMDPKSLIQKIEQHVREELLPKMQKEYREADIVIDSVSGTPSLDAAVDAEITRLVYLLTQETETRKVAYATEAGLFHQAGIPTLVCGPGSIEQAHGPNEFVTTEQIDRCAEFLKHLVQEFLVARSQV